ncbi:MAG: hypothetical protein ACLFPO_05905 [Spirochaetaceae bacterium]
MSTLRGQYTRGGESDTLRFMRRSALESLPRTTDIFESSDLDPAAADYYPPLPVAVDRRDLPEPLRTLLWGWGVVERRGRISGGSEPESGAGEILTRPFEGDARAAVHLLLALEGRAGSYSLEEQRRLVALLDAAGLAPDEETNRLVTGGKPFAPAVRRYAALPSLPREMVAGEQLDLKTAERMQEFPAAAAAAGACTRELSFSNRRRFFTMLWEIAQRDALGDEELAAVVGEVADAPLTNLRARRYPTLSGLEARFDEIAGRALAGSGVRLSPPENFEGSRFTVEFSFDSGRELRRRIEALSGLQDEIDELFSLL